MGWLSPVAEGRVGMSRRFVQAEDFGPVAFRQYLVDRPCRVTPSFGSYYPLRDRDDGDIKPKKADLSRAKALILTSPAASSLLERSGAVRRSEARCWGFQRPSHWQRPDVNLRACLRRLLPASTVSTGPGKGPGLGVEKERNGVGLCHRPSASV